MKTADHPANIPVVSMANESSDSGSSDDRPLHNVAHVPDFRCIPCARDGGDVCGMACSARLPNGIQLSQVPDPRSVREATSKG